MANLIRHDLIIEGPNVQRVLEAIGFKQPSTLNGLNEVVLIDLHRLGHEFNCQWPMPYGGYQEGDLFELTENRASFKFYTKNERTQHIIWALSNRFPGHKFTSKTNDAINGLIAGEVVEGGEQTVFVDVHDHAAACPDYLFNFEEYEELLLKPCSTADCSILFPPLTQADLDRWRADREQKAAKDAAETFHAEDIGSDEVCGDERSHAVGRNTCLKCLADASAGDQGVPL